MNFEGILTIVTFFIALLSTTWLIPIFLFMRLTLTREGYIGLYRAWLLAILSLIVAIISFIVEAFYGPYHHLLHYPSLVLFIWAGIVVARSTGREYILLKVTRELEEGLEKRRGDLMRAKKDWEKTFDSIDEMIIITDREGNILRANKAVARRLNLPIQEVIGLPCHRVVCPIDESGSVCCPVEEVVKTKRPVSIEMDVPHKGWSFWVTAYPFDLDERGEVSTIINIYTDTTHLKRITRLEEDRKRLEEVSRFRAQLVSLISHEIRNPLTSIHGYIELLSTRQVDDETRKRWMGIIHEQIERIQRLADEILQTSRIEAGRLEIKRAKFSLKGLVEEIVEVFKYRSEAHHLEVDIPEGIPFASILYGDREKIGYVLNNLLDNAIKYSPGGGRVFIKVEVQDGQILVGVRDEGVGIPPEEREKVFEPFYRVERGETIGIGGVGIGLSICKTIIELHGGRIWVESEPGKGSIFYFTVPVGEGKGVMA